MERLMDDALRVQRLLPWIESDEDIIHFMRKIPLDKSHLRNQLSLRYFLKQRDSFEDDFEKEIEDDAREIVIVIPDTSYKEIKDRLTVLGNMSNRKEVVLRQLLYEKCDLDKLVGEIDVNCTKKRKSDPHDHSFDLDSRSDETNIKIKIRKRDGSLEVVSTIKQEKVNPSKAVSTMAHMLNEPSPPSTSITSSTSYSDCESSSPDSTVPVILDETNKDPCPEFSSCLQDLIDNNQPSTSGNTSGTTMPVRCKLEFTVPLRNNNNNTDFPNFSNVKKARGNQVCETISKPPEEDSIPSVIPEASKNTSNNSENIGEPEFNLVNFLQTITQAPEKIITSLIKKHNLSAKKPSEEKLNYIFNELFEDVIEVISDNSNLSNASDDTEESTEEYQLPDNYLEASTKAPENPEDTKAGISEMEIPGPRLFKLKAPVLTLPIKTEVSDEDFTLPQPTALFSPPPKNSKRSILKDPVLTLPPTHFKANDEPAMPRTFLDRLQIQRSILEKYKASTSETRMDVVNILEAGPSNVKKKERIIDEKLVLRLIEMFPEACPDYLRDICDGKQWPDFDDIITVILSAENYPRRPQRSSSPAREVDLEEQHKIIMELLPDADPTYLRMQCEKYINDEKGLKEFINQAMELKDYPTMKEYLRKQQLSAQQKQYTTEFNIEHFINLFPDPEKTFHDPNRQIKFDPFSNHYVDLYFRNKFDKLSARAIQQVLYQNQNKIIPSNQALEELAKGKHVMKSRRKHVPLPENMQNIPLLQELAYLTYKKEIETYMQKKLKREEQERLEAKENGLTQTCQCCYEEEIMPKDTFTCPNGCSFCRDCIKRSCEIALGEGKTDFLCLANCSAEFTLQTLQNVLPPKMFSKLAQKKALAEIKAAGIEELEMCPFCDFATIPNEADKIFRCLNPDCMKESCRLCKEPNHVPLKCEEVEKDENVKARTYIENKMTEALIRKCWKCGTSFFKEEGCNKMTCSCGAQMCYVCKQPVKDYSHFNGIGGDKFDLCPLYSDTNLLNQQDVLGAAEAAKTEINPSNLKVDPSADIADHYKKRRDELPREPHLDLINVNGPHIHHQRRHYQQRPHHIAFIQEQHLQGLYWAQQRRHHRRNQ